MSFRKREEISRDLILEAKKGTRETHPYYLEDAKGDVWLLGSSQDRYKLSPILSENSDALFRSKAPYDELVSGLELFEKFEAEGAFKS